MARAAVGEPPVANSQLPSASTSAAATAGGPGGGNAGLCRAISESGRAEAIHVATRQANHVTTPLIRDGLIQHAIAQSPVDLMMRVVALADRATQPPPSGVSLVDFGVYTKFNLPSFGLRPPIPERDWISIG